MTFDEIGFPRQLGREAFSSVSARARRHRTAFIRADALPVTQRPSVTRQGTGLKPAPRLHRGALSPRGTHDPGAGVGVSAGVPSAGDSMAKGAAFPPEPIFSVGIA